MQQIVVYLTVLLGITLSFTPAILIPGGMGSQLEAKLNRTETKHWYCSKTSDWYLIWLTLQQLIGPALNCWADNFKLIYEDGKFDNTPGVQVRPKGFGNLDGVRYVDNLEIISYYQVMIEELLKIQGMKEGVSLRAAPFDYRYSPPSGKTTRYFNRLTRLIEETYEINGKKRVAIISHSMGGLIFSTYLETRPLVWKRQFLHSWSNIGGVMGGALKLVKAFVSHGVIEEVPDVLMSRLVHRRVARTVMSNYWMLPRYPVWQEDEILLRTPTANYTVTTLGDMFRDMEYPEGESKWNAVKNGVYIGDPQIPTYCFHGTDIPTTASYFYNKQENFPDQVPQEVLGMGDGTVPYRSLKICHDWKSTKGVYEYSDEKEGSHLDILKNKDMIRTIIKIISGNESEGHV